MSKIYILEIDKTPVLSASEPYHLIEYLSQYFELPSDKIQSLLEAETYLATCLIPFEVDRYKLYHNQLYYLNIISVEMLR